MRVGGYRERTHPPAAVTFLPLNSKWISRIYKKLSSVKVVVAGGEVASDDIAGIFSKKVLRSSSVNIGVGEPSFLVLT